MMRTLRSTLRVGVRLLSQKGGIRMSLPHTIDINKGSTVDTRMSVPDTR
jgi:hypothetical protein